LALKLRKNLHPPKDSNATLGRQSDRSDEKAVLAGNQHEVGRLKAMRVATPVIETRDLPVLGFRGLFD
jgi:hypothetical protein